MQYRSLNKNSPPVSFREATIQGQAPDKGLYFPDRIPRIEQALLQKITTISKEELSFRVMRPYIGEDIDEETLFRIVTETASFPFPLVPVHDQVFSLELFHGPTLAFKDVGARFMSRCLGYFSKHESGKITVLVATSGDTGGAVANGFLGVDGVDVVILYPSGKVSPVQELQLTTCGQNITALEIAGSFDDCQAMVKDAFMDADIRQKLRLTSANSINVARWLPQQLYYFFAYRDWADKANPPIFSVPSGNFGNLCAGLMAHAAGLPVAHFIAACNTNDAVVAYLHTAEYAPKTAVPTISNAMDVGAPSNFMRVLEIFKSDYHAITKDVSGFTVSDPETRQTIAEVFKKFSYTLDPHGAVAYNALEQYLAMQPGKKGIVLETAHPVKFPEIVEAATGEKLITPDSATALFGKKKQSIKLAASFRELKDWLLGSQV